MAVAFGPAPFGPAPPGPAPRPFLAAGGFGRRLTNPFVGLADDLDRASEEKKSPHNYEGWAYVILTPWLGLAIFILGFPVLWWNERRATGRKAPPAPAAAMGGAAGSAEGSPAKGTSEKVPRDAEAVEGTPVKQEGESLLVHPEKAYHEAVESFETQHCNYLCCRGVKRCFEAMPQLEGAGDFRTYFFRVFGVCMMFTGIDMMLAPTYFMLRNAWFFGFLIAAHLAICACKSSCILSCCTILSSYVLHRPGIVALLATSIVAVSGLSIYYNAPAAHR